MSTLAPAPAPPDVRAPTPKKTDDSRGRHAMRCVIATESSLFIVLFFSYFYLSTPSRWEVQRPPELTYAFIMLAVLLLSSAVLHIGELAARSHKYRAARVYLGGTVLLGLIFLALQYVETKQHLKILTPQSDAYGSLFYTITFFHGAHLTMGLLMLAYVLVLPKPANTDQSPFQPYHVASMYWHFVDFIWIWIVAVLYVAPHFQH
jgi:heme/copper-type cytochrome/quinol oxidase subunit 3